MKKNRIAAAAILGALSLGVGAPAFAQTAPTTAPIPVASTTAPNNINETRSTEKAARRDTQAADLATRLGITKEKLLAAMDAQASTAPTRSSTGTRPTAVERKAAATARVTAFAASLGVSVDALTKAVADQAKAQIDTKVTDGSLTTGQATARKAVIDADAAAGDVRGLGGHGGHGGHDGHGGRGGRGHGGRK
jgi:hypothetical protein